MKPGVLYSETIAMPKAWHSLRKRVSSAAFSGA
jgi:hypothetical protein